MDRKVGVVGSGMKMMGVDVIGDGMIEAMVMRGGNDMRWR